MIKFSVLLGYLNYHLCLYFHGEIEARKAPMACLLFQHNYSVSWKRLYKTEISTNLFQLCKILMLKKGVCGICSKSKEIKNVLDYFQEIIIIHFVFYL